MSIQAEFGFGNNLSVYFWVGISLLVVGAYLVLGSNELFHILVLLSVSVVVWGMPFFAVDLPYHTDTFWHMSNAQWIRNTNMLDFQLAQPHTRFTYLQYPSLFVNTAILMLVPALNEIAIMKFFIIGATVLFTFNFYILARFLFDSKDKAYFATLLVLCGNLAMLSNHYSPSALGEVLFPMAIYLLLRVLSVPQSRYITALIILTFLCVTLHPVTSLMYLAVVLAASIFQWRDVRSGNRNQTAIGILLLTGTLFFGWQIFVGTWGLSNFGQSLKNLEEVVLGFGKQSTLTTTILKRQTLVFPMVGWIKRLVFLSFVLPTLLIVFKDFAKKTIDSVETIFVSIFAIWLLSSLVTDVSDRFLVWVIPFSVIVLLRRLNYTFHKKKGLLVLSKMAILLLPLLLASTIILTYYSGGAMYVTTNAEYAGFQNLVTTLKQKDTVYGRDFGVIFFYAPYNATLFQVYSIQYARVLCFNKGFYSYSYYTEGGPLNSFTTAFNQSINDPHFNTIYSSEDFLILQRNARAIVGRASRAVLERNSS